MLAAWAPGGIYEPFQATTVGNSVLLQTYAPDKNTAIVSSSDLKTPLKSSKGKDMNFFWQYSLTPALTQSGSDVVAYYAEDGYLVMGSIQGNGVKPLPDVTFDGYYNKQLNKAVSFKNRPEVADIADTEKGLFNCAGSEGGRTSATYVMNIPIGHFKYMMGLPQDKPMPENYTIQINSISFYIVEKPMAPITNLKISIYVSYQAVATRTIPSYMPDVEGGFDTIQFTELKGITVKDITPISVVISYEYSDNSCKVRLYEDFPASTSYFSYPKNKDETVFYKYYGDNPIDILNGRNDEFQTTVNLTTKPVMRFGSVISSKEIVFFRNSADMTLIPGSGGKFNIFSVSNYDESLQSFDLITMKSRTVVESASSTSYFKKSTLFLACCGITGPSFKHAYAAVVETDTNLERTRICFYNASQLNLLRDADTTVVFLNKKVQAARALFVVDGIKDVLGGTSGDRLFVFYDSAPYVSAFRVTEVVGGVSTSTLAIPASLSAVLPTLANPILPTPISDASVGLIKQNLLPEPEPPVTPENIVIYRRLEPSGPSAVRETLPFLIPVINPRAAVKPDDGQPHGPSPSPATHAPDDEKPAPLSKERLLLRHMRGFLEGQSRTDLQTKRRILERLENMEQRMLAYGQQGQQVGEEEYRVFQTELRLLHRMIQDSSKPTEDLQTEIQEMKWSLPPMLDGRATRRIFERLENLEKRMLSYSAAGQQITEEAAEAFRTELNVLRRMMAEAKTP